jgi:hypothetical protein
MEETNLLQPRALVDRIMQVSICSSSKLGIQTCVSTVGLPPCAWCAAWSKDVPVVCVSVSIDTKTCSVLRPNS